MPLGMEVGLGQATLCSMGTQLPQKKGHSPPNFWPMSFVAKRPYGQEPLGTELNLGPGDIVLGGVAAPP